MQDEEKGGTFAAYHIQVDELNDKVVQTLKNIYRQGEIVILPKDGGAECQGTSLDLRCATR